jgi:hypothetical protein
MKTVLLSDDVVSRITKRISTRAYERVGGFTLTESEVREIIEGEIANESQSLGTSEQLPRESEVTGKLVEALRGMLESFEMLTDDTSPFVKNEVAMGCIRGVFLMEPQKSRDALAAYDAQVKERRDVSQ